MANLRHLSNALIVALVALFATTGCGNDERRAMPRAAAPAPQVVGQTAAGISTDDFQLGIVVTNVTRPGSGLTEMQNLTAFVNEPNSGVNYVDIDQDGTVDYVQAREQADPQGKMVVFVACPSASAVSDCSDGENVANITITQSPGGEVIVAGGYPQHVRGWNSSSSYYERRARARDIAFLTYMLMPHRPIFVHRPYGSFRVHHRPMISVQQRTTVRNTYRTTTKTTKMTPKARPANARSAKARPATAKRVSKAKATAGKTPKTMKGAGKGVRDFKAGNQNKSNTKGNSLLGKKKKAGQKASPAAPRAPAPRAAPKPQQRRQQAAPRPQQRRQQAAPKRRGGGMKKRRR